MAYRIIKPLSEPKGNIISDVLVELETPKSYEAYPKFIRMVTADVEIDGKEKRISFITNNIDWAPSSICDLYKCRWGVEVFFKQIKQTLQLADFVGHSQNAILWQVWMALLAYVLIRFVGYLGKWQGTFKRLFTLLRGVMFSRLDIYSVMDSCGIARGSPRMVGSPQQAYLPGFELR